MLRRLSPHILIAKVEGGSTAFFPKDPISDEIGKSRIQKIHLAVFRPINRPLKIFIFDQNDCLVPDKFFQLEYYNTIVRMSRKLFLENDRERLTTSIRRYGKDGCLSNEYNGFFPEDGAVCNFEVDNSCKPVVHELRFPDGSIISDPEVIKEYIRRRSPPVPFLGKYDQTSIFWLLIRRGMDEKTFRTITAAAYSETISQEELLLPGINSLLSDFFERFNHKTGIMMIATDNSAEITLAALEKLGIRNEIKEVYARVDKIHNYPSLIRYLIDKYHVEPSEIVVFGDSYWSDIHPLLKSEFKSDVITVHINSGRNYLDTYLRNGAPSISADTLDAVFRYMIEKIPEKPGKAIVHR